MRSGALVAQAETSNITAPGIQCSTKVTFKTLGVTDSRSQLIKKELLNQQAGTTALTSSGLLAQAEISNIRDSSEFLVRGGWYFCWGGYPLLTRFPRGV